MLTAFRKPGTQTDEGTRLAAAVDDYTRQLTQNPLLGGRLIQRIAVSTTPVNVAHGLGRSWQGWVVTRVDAGITVFEATTQANSAQFISLDATNSGTIDIYIF
jgi:hypothetical protein